MRSRRRHRRRNRDWWMESDMKTSSERMKAGAERATRVRAGGEGPLRIRCCVTEI